MDRKRKIQINVSPTGDDFQVNKCEASKCLGQDKDNKCDSALSGVTHHNGYRGKICDIWHRKGDERLFTDWLDELKKNSSLLRGREENLKVTPPYVVTHTCVVELIFRMCKDLKQPADTRYRTVELFDRFIANQFVELVKSVKKKQDQITEWDGIVENVSSNALLRVISCIQLASKYCAHSTIVPPKTALLYLTKRGLSVSVQNVLSSEARVFKSLNFDIGVPTLLVYVDTLLPLMRDIIHDKIYTVCINILDIIYLQRNHIFKNLSDKIIKNWTHSHSNKLKFSSYEFDGLFCGAATITTAVRIYYPNNKNTALMVNEKLANFIEKPADDILTFSNVILQTVGIQ